jgi:hypothetical protein
MVAGFPSIWPKVNLPDGGSRNKKQDAWASHTGIRCL